METNDVFDSPIGLVIDGQQAHIGPMTEVDLLADVGIGADLVYTGDAHGCPHCRAKMVSRAA